MNMKQFIRTLLTGFLIGPLLATSAAALASEEAAPDGWVSRSPRDEIRPKFAFRAEGNNLASGLIIKADEREGLFGWWEKAYPVRGGASYRFAARYKAERVRWPRTDDRGTDPLDRLQRATRAP